LIDFDAGFFKDETRDDVELGGDLTYLAPETFLAMTGETVTLTEKTDIFSLGLVFHEFFTGELPAFNQAEYEYPFEAVLDGGGLTVNQTMIPCEFEDLILKMLSAEPDDRPSSEDIVRLLAGISGFRTVPPMDTPPAVKPPIPPNPTTPSSSGWFRTAGDL